MSDILINSFSVQPAFSYSNGTVDSAFATNVGTASNLTVVTACPDPANGIIVGGTFTSWNGVAVNYLLRLNENGTRDTSFQTNLGTGPNSTVYMVKYSSIQDKFYVVGSFTTWNGTAVNRVARLNRNGTLDTSFSVGTAPSNYATCVAEQSDGKIIVGGNFGTWSGVSVGRIVRLDATGARDTAFNTNIGTGGSASGLTDVAVGSDGKITLVGNFPAFSGVTTKMARLNSDGTRDTAFNTNIGAAMTGTSTPDSRIALQADGKTLISGKFTSWNNGATLSAMYFIRINVDGTQDTAFSTSLGTGFDSYTKPVFVQNDGKILVGGLFGAFNGVTTGSIVRLNSDGTRDTTWPAETALAYSDVFDLRSDGLFRFVAGGTNNTGIGSWNGLARFS